MNIAKVAFVAYFSLASSLSLADRDEHAGIKAAVKKVLPDAEITSVGLAPLPGMYEVMVGPTALYVSGDGRYIIKGDIYDISTLQNLTRVRQAKARVDAFQSLDSNDVIEFAPRSGKTKRTLYVYTDIDCGYCRKLHTEVNQLTDAGITVRYLAYPRSGLKGDSYAKAVAVWCSSNRQTAMTQSKAGKLVSSPKCDNPVADHYRVGEAMGIRGTPAVYSDEGEQLGGYVPAADLIRMLIGREG
jgi:thiol:disulfide interchange protein DsbC